LRLTAKALGEGSAGLFRIRPGTRVFAEGPYGAFTGMHRRAANALLIAGGVGITPVRALLEELHGHLVVLYRVNSDADAVLLPELHALAHRRGAVVHLLPGPPTATSAYGPLLGPHNIAALVPDVLHRDVYVCGPPGMTDAVMDSLRQLGVRRDQIHAERFALAS
jgi:ferredoxin-NADP reductase